LVLQFFLSHSVVLLFYDSKFNWFLAFLVTVK